MKKALWPVAVLVAAGLASSACVAQTNRGDLMVNIPFRFVAGNQTLPAGRYLVTQLGEINLRIYNSQNRGALVATHSAQGKTAESTGRMVFRRYGDTYVLTQVWFAANSTGRLLFRSHIEEELATTGTVGEVAVLQVKP
jgi:hypothetical protein